MATHKSIIWLAILLVYVFNTDSIPSKKFSCPEVCDCYLSRINWVTNCMNKNLTFIPHKGLDLDTYILNMNDNFLSELEPFPHSIKVWTLQLSNNLLTEIKNTTFDGLHHLLDIDLSNNLISYVQPYAFNDSNGLIKIDLHGNQLKPVDEPFLYSKVLLNLNLAYCRITEISPLFFFNISNLNTLDLSGNSLEEIKPIIFNPLKNLKHLILNDCNLTYISIHAFRGLKELSRLELAQNKLTSDVDWTLVLSHLSRLDYLDLRKAGVAQLTIDAFAKNTWLRNLVLAENKLTGGFHVAITLGENLRHLDLLDLSNCDLRGPVFENAFTHATKLRTLILSGNHLISSNLSTNLSPLVKLVTLSLSDCGLYKLPENTFKQLTHLKELDISRNPLMKDNGSLKFLSILESLEYLDIGYSNLEQISATFFSKMSNLKTLILSGNKLVYLERGLFQELKSLQVLELNDCGLSSLNYILFFDDFAYYPNLVELRISRNPIRIPEEGSIFPFAMSNLNNLDMSKCNISYLPKGFFISTPNLKQLLLNDNKLNGNETDMEFMKHLTNIEEINLNFNDMKSIVPDVFHHNNRLVSLKLIGNPWICECFIVDMWNWAIIKGNIDILDGSTRLYSYVKDKNTSYLTCIYNPNITPYMRPRNPSLSGPTLNTRFTWQRYAHDAICPPIIITVSRSGRAITRDVHGYQPLQ